MPENAGSVNTIYAGRLASVESVFPRWKNVFGKTSTTLP